MAIYDEQILQKFVDQLYDRANSMVILGALKYGLWALVFAFVGAVVLQRFIHEDLPYAAIGFFVVVLSVLAGISEGKARAFTLKLQAQEALLQMQIEKNTRK